MTFSSGFHYIVIDAISDDLKSVRIRDPYHGWEIDVRAEAFIKHLGHDISRGIVALKSKPKEK